MAANRSSSGDVTLMIKRLESGDHEAAAALWTQCYPRLLKYCRSKLPDSMRRVLDEEDAALSAFHSLCARVGSDKMSIRDRDELWRMLFCIAGRKAHGYVREQLRLKRGAGKVSGESIFYNAQESSHPPSIAEIESSGNSPVSLEQFTQDCQELLDELADERLQTIALLRMEGYSVDEIASRFQCAKRSVERRLQLIRTIWQAHSTSYPD